MNSLFERTSRDSKKRLRRRDFLSTNPCCAGDRSGVALDDARDHRASDAHHRRRLRLQRGRARVRTTAASASLERSLSREESLSKSGASNYTECRRSVFSFQKGVTRARLAKRRRFSLSLSKRVSKRRRRSVPRRVHARLSHTHTHTHTHTELTQATLFLACEASETRHKTDQRPQRCERADSVRRRYRCSKLEYLRVSFSLRSIWCHDR